MFTAAAILLCMSTLPRSSKLTQLLEICAVSPRFATPEVLPSTSTQSSLREAVMIQFKSDLPLAVLSLLQTAERFSVPLTSLVRVKKHHLPPKLPEIAYSIAKRCKKRLKASTENATKSAKDTAALLSDVLHDTLEVGKQGRKLRHLLSGKPMLRRLCCVFHEAWCNLVVAVQALMMTEKKR